MGTEGIVLLLLSLVLFGLLQAACLTAGNCPYSMYYESHGLVKKKGLLQLIYFPPKHFHRYSLWEVTFFFGSYVIFFTEMILFGIGFAVPQAHFIGLHVSWISLLVGLLAELCRAIAIRFQNRSERNLRNEPMPEFGENEYEKGLVAQSVRQGIVYRGTVRGALEALYEKKTTQAPYEVLEAIDEEFIQYYRDCHKIYVEGNKVIYR